LRANAQIINDYLTTGRRIDREREASDHRSLRPANPYFADYQALVEEIGRDMETRAIRAWH
jgi:hypothetical protein